MTLAPSKPKARIENRRSTQETTADLVNRLRSKGYTCMDLGKFLDIHWRTIYRWGRGDTHPSAPKAVNQVLETLLKTDGTGRALPDLRLKTTIATN